MAGVEQVYEKEQCETKCTASGVQTKPEAALSLKERLEKSLKAQQDCFSVTMENLSKETAQTAKFHVEGIRATQRALELLGKHPEFAEFYELMEGFGYRRLY